MFARSLAEKMLTYALGRGLEYYDKCAVDKIVEALEKNDYRFSTLIVETVKSDPFQMRTGQTRETSHDHIADGSPGGRCCAASARWWPCPVLEAMLPRSPRSRRTRPPTRPTTPRRMAFIYVPNGVNMDDWTPDGGRDRLRAAVDPAAAGRASSRTCWCSAA